MIGFVLWALLLTGIAVLEACGVLLRGHQWPSISDLLRVATRPAWGRWVMFALWLWLGWHLFIRGWSFFLRGSGAAEPGKGLGGGKTFSEAIKQVILPLVIVYVGFVAMLFRGWRVRLSTTALPTVRSAARAIRGRPLSFVLYSGATIGIGYAVFVGMMALYQLVVGQSAGGVARSALGGGAFLAFAVALPCFVVCALVLGSPTLRRRRASDAA